MDFGNRSDNPFAVPLRRKAPNRRKALTSAMKVLCLAAIALGATLVVSSQSQLWLAHQLTDNFDSLPTKEKTARLLQISALGVVGIEPLVHAMADQEVEVARTAYEMLRKCQNEWTVLPDERQFQRHGVLVSSLRTVAMDIPDDRTGWGTNLLQQTMIAAMERDAKASRDVYTEASQIMKLFALTDRAPSAEDGENFDRDSPRRLTVTSEPLPVVASMFDDPWNHRTRRDGSGVFDNNAIVISGSGPATQVAVAATSSGGRTIPVSATQPISATPSVYRSNAARLQPAEADAGVDLHELDSLENHRKQTLGSGNEIIESPMQTFDDVSVMRWLGSPHQALREKAELELTSRGYDGTSITIATRIMSGDVDTKLALMDALAKEASIDPRPWLLMLLKDENRAVKLQAISVLGTMSDPEIRGKLQTHLVEETDPTVSARIERILKLR